MPYVRNSTYIKTNTPDVTVDLVKAALGISVGVEQDDALLAIYLGSSKEAADKYCCNDFSEGPVPDGVKTWIIKDAVSTYENTDPKVRGRAVNGQGSQDIDLSDLVRFQGLALFSLKSPVRHKRYAYGRPI